MEKKLYCEHCREDVMTYTVNRYGSEELCCLHCGLPLEKMEADAVVMAKIDFHGKVLCADDSPLMREMLKDIFSNTFNGAFEAFSDGEALIYNYTRALMLDEVIGMLILDIKMPYISGISTGIAVRAVEKAFGRDPVPILYFSAQKADEEMKKFFQHTPPSYYINKGATSNMTDLASRLAQAVRKVLGL